MTGLSINDIRLLDCFEGNVGRNSFVLRTLLNKTQQEYTREKEFVHPLKDFIDLSNYTVSEEQSLVPAAPPPLPEKLGTPFGVDTYVYRDISFLEAELWSFDDFVKHNGWKWYGKGADNNADYQEVDRRNAENGGGMDEKQAEEELAVN